MMRVLVITQLFPSRARPLAAAFNRQQFAALGRLCDVEVVATVPWFPGRNTAPPGRDTIDGLPVRYARVLRPPGLHGLSAFTLTASLAPGLLRERGRVDAVLGSWAHPEGSAAIMLASLLRAPSVIKCHGTDLNVIADLPGPRAVLRRLLPRADRVVVVSRALGERARGLGVAPDRIDLVMNGVDAALFRVRDREEARARLGREPDQPLALYVGNLLEQKGVPDLCEAWPRVVAEVPAARLVVVGDGPARPALATHAAALPGLELAGSRPLAEVADWMAAADLVVLPSWNEGTPNVVLEALACGRRVVATAVGGIPDLVHAPALGRLVPPRSPRALAGALAALLTAPYQPREVAELGSGGDWDESARALLDSLDRAVACYDRGA
jgi:teichuronic acid biosynthesis glycosyltransferase TuaC